MSRSRRRLRRIIEIFYLGVLLLSTAVLFFILPDGLIRSLGILRWVFLTTFLFFLFAVVFIALRRKLYRVFHAFLNAYFHILCALLAFRTLFWLFYWIVITLFPAVTREGGEYHPVMPFGQLFFALVFSFVVSLTITVVYAASYNIMKRFRDSLAGGPPPSAGMRSPPGGA
ncbi:MAG TPA: hypothetical protein ENN69_02935 [Spirochaetia bacterium]|nr:hypothetical protein [Spirochaetia bacterium]